MDADDRQIAGAASEQGALIPPRDLIERTDGRRPELSDEWFSEHYEQAGRARKAAIIGALPDGYSFEGRRVLDFGCGAGRVLREFLPEAASGEFWGCDLHRPTIAWLDEHLSPPLHFYVNDEIPTPHPDGYFDLVYAISVFTHITHEWSAWLLELHRILKPEGLLLATFCGPELWGKLLGKPPDENGLGMCVTGLRASPDDTSGPQVMHSPWWLRSHWGRAFEILSLRSSGFVGYYAGQGLVLGRKKGVSLTLEDLERPEPGDPRELAAQRLQLVVLEEEAVEVREGWERTRAGNAKLVEARERQRAHTARVSEALERQRARSAKLSEALERQRAREQQRLKLLKAMLRSRAFAVAEQLSRLHQRGRPVFSRQQIRRALGEQDRRD